MEKENNSPVKRKALIGAMVVSLILPGLTFAQVSRQVESSRNPDSSIVMESVDPAIRAHDSTNRDTLTILRDTLGNPIDTIAARKDTLSAPVIGTPVPKDTLDIISSDAAFNTMPGFRVQLMSTQNLSDAIDARAEADSLLSSYNVYIIYDSPYYKVRAGDFRVRYDATQAADYMASHGFPNAWLVPDNVFKDPQRKSSKQ
ncbi:MAG: SPOR domain-containing protein [Candidatus Kryptoniota bacterium]